MRRQVRRVAAAVFVLFAALLVNLNYLQVLEANELANNPSNSRVLVREYAIRRGLIRAGERGDEPIASSVETNDRLRFLRRYPEGELYAHTTGFYSFVFGRAQLEASMNEFLTGDAPEAFAGNVADLLAGRERVGDDVVTTLHPEVQAAARDALGDRKGAVVALDPSTGALLAMWSNPSYDPNLLSSHDGEEIRATWDQLNADPDDPLVNRALNALYPPGSTFKLITAAAALEAGIRPEQTFPDPVELDLPLTTATIPNFGGGTCTDGGEITLRQALEVSCNTTFARLGLDLGPARLADKAEDFGINADPPLQLPVEPSVFPRRLDEPATAQSAIGQRDVRVTPLQMALVAGAIGNGGTMMTPRIVEQVEAAAGRAIREFPPAPLVLPGRDDAPAMNQANAVILRDMMIGVVDAGSGTRAALPGVQVAGKTGTAQTGEGVAPTVWFVGFAPAERPTVAVAVVIERGGDVGSEASGGRVAAPVARDVLAAALRTSR